MCVRARCACARTLYVRARTTCAPVVRARALCALYPPRLVRALMHLADGKGVICVPNCPSKPIKIAAGGVCKTAVASHCDIARFQPVCCIAPVKTCPFEAVYTSERVLCARALCARALCVRPRCVRARAKRARA